MPAGRRRRDRDPPRHRHRAGTGWRSHVCRQSEISPASRHDARVGHHSVEPANRPKARAPSLLRSANPYLAFAKAVGLLTHSAPPPRGIDRLSAVAPTAQLGADVSIGAFVVVGDGAVDRRAHDRVSQRRDRSRRDDRRRLRRARARVDSRARADRPSCDRAGRRGHRQRRIRIRPAVGRHASQDPAARRRGHRRRCRNRREYDHRSPGGRRDADRRGHEDRQPRANRARRQRSGGACCLRRKSASRAARRSRTTWSWRGRSASPDICESAKASWPRRRPACRIPSMQER